MWPAPSTSLEHVAAAGDGARVFLSASRKADMRVVDAHGHVLARVDAAGLQTYDAALSCDGRFVAAATFTSDVKVGTASWPLGLRDQHVTQGWSNFHSGIYYHHLIPNCYPLNDEHACAALPTCPWTPESKGWL